MKDTFSTMKKEINNPSEGLPEDIFLFISSIIPMVNVDLLIKNESGHTLLAWRDDEYTGKGWHIPGGIIRFKETIENRIKQVAITEVGTEVEYNLKPLCINEIFNPNRNTRGHFISLLYNCLLHSSYSLPNKDSKSSDVGYLQWHTSCPNNLLPFHEIYRNYI